MRVLNSNRIGRLFALLAMLPMLAFAQQPGRLYSYIEAYNICTPIAQQISRTKCGYGRVYESYYTQCMAGRGYRDTAEFSQEDYGGYMDAYRYCASSADIETKRYCRYGELYNVEYSQCMSRYGFDRNGEREVGGYGDTGSSFKFDF